MCVTNPTSDSRSNVMSTDWRCAENVITGLNLKNRYICVFLRSRRHIFNMSSLGQTRGPTCYVRKTKTRRHEKATQKGEVRSRSTLPRLLAQSRADSKSMTRASSRATTSEGAEAAPDTSPPRLPPERPPMCSRGNEGTLQCWSGGTNFVTSLTPYLPLDTAAGAQG